LNLEFWKGGESYLVSLYNELFMKHNSLCTSNTIVHDAKFFFTLFIIIIIIIENL